MTDDTNTAPTVRGGDGPNRNLPITTPDVPALSTDPLPAISYTEAESRKAELFGNSEWFNRYMNGDVEAIREYNQIVAGLTATPPSPQTEGEAMAERMERFAVISPEVKQEMRERPFVTSTEHEGAKQLRSRLAEDEEWLQQYNRGDIRARQQIEYINGILARPVRDNP